MREEHTGRLEDGATGRLIISDGLMTLEIDRHFEPDATRPFRAMEAASTILMRLGGGAVATISGVSPLVRETRVDHERLLLQASRVVIGARAFDETGSIIGIRFVPSNQLHAIHYRGHLTSGGSNDLSNQLSSVSKPSGPLMRYQVEVIDHERLEVARMVMEDMSVRMDVSVSTMLSRQSPRRTETRRVSLDYRNGSDVGTAVQDVRCACALLSTMLGKVVAPRQITFAASPGDGTSPEEVHRLHARFEDPAPEMRLADLNTGLLSPDEDRVGYETALRVWFERRGAWRRAMDFAMEAFSMEDRVTRNRFLNATGWFEAIPGIDQGGDRIVPRDVLEEASRCAATVLQDRGYGGAGERMNGLMSTLNNPSLGMRLRAAVASIRERFGDDVLPADADATCRLIPQIRGAYAHGDDPLLGRHGSRVREATLMMETMCYLLAIRDLGFGIDFHLGSDHLLTRSIADLRAMATMRSR